MDESNVFIITVYIKNWFLAPLPTCAPNNDLQLVKTLAQYDNLEISKATIKKMIGHSRYLLDELVELYLFDHNVSVETKCKIVYAIIHNPSPEIRNI